MSYRPLAIDIIGQAVGAMTFPVEVKKVVQNNDGTQTLTVCDAFHAQAGFPVVIDEVEYQITAVEYNPDKITVSGSTTITADGFELYHPYFFHGTPIATGVELSNQTDSFMKTPMVWMMEQYDEEIYLNNHNPYDRTLSVRLFFLTQGDHENWETSDAYQNAIIPMRRLQERFEQLMIDSPDKFNTDVLSVEILNYAKFGVYINNKGMPKGLFADKLSGCEMNLRDLNIYRDFGTCEPCFVAPDPPINTSSFDDSFDDSFG